MYNRKFLFSNVYSIQNLHLTAGPTYIRDKYYSNPIQFWNVIDYFKHRDFKKLSNNANNIFISNFKFTLAHFLCSEGNAEALKHLFESPKFVFKCDEFNNNPIHYSIKKKHQNCTDEILEFLFSEKSLNKKHFEQSIYSFKNNFTSIIENSSKNLPMFLKNLIKKVRYI